MPRILEPANARSVATRIALLRSARALLEETGFEALTMAAVAERAGVTRRAVYLHFASRAELLNALFDFVGEEGGLASSTARVWTSRDAVSALEEWAAHLVRFHPQVIELTRAADRLHQRDPGAAQHRERFMREQHAACRRLARWLQREDKLHRDWSVESAADMLFALISSDLLDRLLNVRGWSRQRLSRHLAVLLRSTFITADT